MLVSVEYDEEVGAATLLNSIEQDECQVQQCARKWTYFGNKPPLAEIRTTGIQLVSIMLVLALLKRGGIFWPNGHCHPDSSRRPTHQLGPCMTGQESE